MAESGPTIGWIDHEPDYDEDHLYETAGYVEWIRIEQEQGRQSLHFGLRIYTMAEDTFTRYHEQKFWIYLDYNTTTTLAQLQLLRDAMWSGKVGFPYLVHVHFNFAFEDTEEWAHVYWLTVRLTDEAPITVGAFRGRPTAGWYYHEG